MTRRSSIAHGEAQPHEPRNSKPNLGSERFGFLWNGVVNLITNYFAWWTPQEALDNKGINLCATPGIQVPCASRPTPTSPYSYATVLVCRRKLKTQIIINSIILYYIIIQFQQADWLVCKLHWRTRKRQVGFVAGRNACSCWIMSEIRCLQWELSLLYHFCSIPRSCI